MFFPLCFLVREKLVTMGGKGSKQAPKEEPLTEEQQVTRLIPQRTNIFFSPSFFCFHFLSAPDELVHLASGGDFNIKTFLY